MRFLIEPCCTDSLAGLRDYANAVECSGLDGLFLTGTDALPAPLVTAAAVAAANDVVLLAVDVELGDRHPVEVAEECAVVDQASRGRLIAVLSAADGHAADFDEATDLLRLAWGARPFRLDGRRWQVPAGEGRVRVTPSPFGARVETWVAGREACRVQWRDPDTLLRELERERATEDRGWAIVAAPLGALAAIGKAVRPRLALDRLPPGLTELWDS